MLLLPSGEAHQRQRPEVSLRCTLEVHLIKQCLDGGLRGVAVLELEPADARVDRFQHRAVHSVHRRLLPAAIEHFSFGEIDAQHRVERTYWRRQPVGFQRRPR